MYYPCSENKGADQLRGYREADLRLCFRICKKPVFSWRGSFKVQNKKIMVFNLQYSQYSDKNFRLCVSVCVGLSVCMVPTFCQQTDIPGPDLHHSNCCQGMVPLHLRHLNIPARMDYRL